MKCYTISWRLGESSPFCFRRVPRNSAKILEQLNLGSTKETIAELSWGGIAQGHQMDSPPLYFREKIWSKSNYLIRKISFQFVMPITGSANWKTSCHSGVSAGTQKYLVNFLLTVRFGCRALFSFRVQRPSLRPPSWAWSTCLCNITSRFHRGAPLCNKRNSTPQPAKFLLRAVRSVESLFRKDNMAKAAFVLHFRLGKKCDQHFEILKSDPGSVGGKCGAFIIPGAAFEKVLGVWMKSEMPLKITFFPGLRAKYSRNGFPANVCCSSPPG